MSLASTAYTVLRLYASKKASSTVSLGDFMSYISKYAQRFVEEQPELSPFLQNTVSAVNQSVEELLAEQKILLRGEADKKTIIVTSFYRDILIVRYKEISANPAVHFPTRGDMPKDFPNELLLNKEATELLYDFFDRKPRPEGVSENIIYSLSFNKPVEGMLIPDGLSPELLLDLAISKVKRLMSKSGQYDYYLKKMIAVNTGKEISAKSFFSQFVSQTSTAVHNIKQGGDSYYYWNQLLTFINNDIEKIQDKLQDDVSVLQSLCLIEICAAYYKSKSQASLQKETALKNLDLSMAKPPFRYTYDDITRFVDSRGIPLLGQFEADDLSEYLKTKTTTSSENKLPEILIFKIEDGTRYYILKSKVIPLLISLFSSMRDVLRKNITGDWFEKLQDFQTEPAMHEQPAFEVKLQDEVRRESQIMHALLTSSFLPVVYQEAKDVQDKTSSYKLFSDRNDLLPYSELFIISRSALLTDAKILLPIWYTVPILSFIFRLFLGRKENPKKSKKGSRVQAKDEGSITLGAQAASTEKTKKAQQVELKKAAENVIKKIVPSSSSLSNELAKSMHEWNRMLNKTAKDNLTEDVNSLIRDYVRKSSHKLKASTLTLDAISDLAETLARSSSLTKIQETASLTHYIKLYILQLLK